MPWYAQGIIHIQRGETIFMENFEFFTPTRMIFGKDTHLQVGTIVKEYGFKKVLVHFGGASARKTGLLDTVLDALKAQGISCVTLGESLHLSETHWPTVKHEGVGLSDL